MRLKTNDQMLLEKAYVTILEDGANQQPKVLQQAPGENNNNQHPLKINKFGDLLKIIRGIQLKNKGSKILDKSVSFAVDQVLGLIPGASNARTAYDFLKTAFERPDAKKTNTVIDKLNVDDEVAKIVDQSIEARFLNHLNDIIQNYGAETPIPADWNITKELQTFLQTNYNNRTITLPEQK